MFSGCTALEDAPKMSATTLANICCESMFAGCTSLTGAPRLHATELAMDCYKGMFAGCTSLTDAPQLDAVMLVYGCYKNMFIGCTSLSRIKCLAVVGENNLQGSVDNWVRGVSSSGDFYKAISATKWTPGYSGIPRNWTIYDVEQE